MYGKEIAKKAIARLREEDSGALSEISEESVSRRTLTSLEIEEELVKEEEMNPAEITALTKRIQEKRLTAPGLSREDSQSLIERIGLKCRRG